MGKRIELTEEQILELFRGEPDQPLSLRDIQSAFDLSAGQRKRVGMLVKDLVRQGVLKRAKGGRFLLREGGQEVVGVISIHRDGYGFVTVGEGRDDIFVPARLVRPAMHGDRVAVRLERDPRSGRAMGRVTAVTERRHTSLIGQFQKLGSAGSIRPADPHLREDILIPAGAEAGAAPGEMVVVTIEAYPGRSRSATGRIIEVLGDPDDPAVEIRIVAERFELPQSFSAAALAEAETVAETVRPADLKARDDLRHVPFVTIDGETAKDFDDAVAIEAGAGGGFRLWVAIADVAHYVRPGSAIDHDALERGTSVYFPGACIPMLPEKLSNGICSLNPGEDRLAMVAELDCDAGGRPRAARFFAGVIRSRYRLTYTEVRQILVDGDPEVSERYRDLVPDLQRMAAFTEQRMARRRERGSLDFDLPTAEIVLDLRGRPENIVRAERHLAHRLIEEMMLAANEAVASWLEQQQVPLIFRVHDRPGEEKLAQLQDFLAHFNQGLAIAETGVTPKILQDLLSRVTGRPEERVINHVLLRSLPQAVYEVINSGHFGLAADSYCHFTSPIRRYPDLVVHRILKQVLGLTRQESLPKGVSLGEAATRSTVCERRAMNAERDILDLKKCQFMAGKVGEVCRGLIVSVQPFGFFVELQDYYVEGLVHVSSLEDDFYQFEEEHQWLIGMRRRRKFEIGDLVEVLVHKVEPERREISFLLQGQETDEPARRSRRTKARRRTAS